MFPFKFEKTLQAVAALLRAEPLHCMSRLRLIKLLYMADRDSLRETGAPITGDSAFAMKNGPVLSQTYDLIKGEHVRAGEWRRFFVNCGHLVQLADDPGTGRLSKYEIAKLNEISEKFRVKDAWDMVEVTHGLAEWHDPGASSRRIPLKDILTAVGRGDDIKEIEEDAEAETFFDHVLGTD